MAEGTWSDRDGASYAATRCPQTIECACEEKWTAVRILSRGASGETHYADVCDDCFSHIKRECVDPDPYWHPSDELTSRQIEKITSVTRTGEFYVVPKRWHPVEAARVSA